MDIEKLKRFVSYDPDTGLLRWNVDVGRWGRIKAGTVAGCLCPTNGYFKVRIDGDLYAVHRVAWALFYGEQPPEVIDHINTVRDDNRICNLRPADAQGNNANRNVSAKNPTGFKGVFMDRKRGGKFFAQGRFNGKSVYLGRFDAAKAAADAYDAWASATFGEYARLNNGTNPI